MKNIDLLFKAKGTSNKKVIIDKNSIRIDIHSHLERYGVFSGIEIKEIIQQVNKVHERYKNLKIPINIHLHNLIFIDKLTYVFVECICYYLIKECGHRVQIFMEVIKDIGTEGVDSSPLLLLNNTSANSIAKFPDRFNKDIYWYHFRKVVDGVGKEATNYLGDLYKEVDSFLKPFGIDDICRNEVGLVITELVGNACEHALTDCLIDIDVSPGFKKRAGLKEDKNFYYGINIAVINFSDKLLGDDINTNIIEESEVAFSSKDRYKKVFTAYKNHSVHFDKKYTHEDFRNITTFQSKISGRKDKFDTGGTGLPTLIKSLEDRSDNYRCYVISGKRCINFYSELLEYDINGWIGFNEERDYFNNIPGEKVMGECFIDMPGTAYNLNFIMKGEKI